jgi:hypothetical protein
VKVPVLEVSSVEPKYGVNYNAGYIGFTFHDKTFLSNGIAYFTRWERLNQIRVSHVFIVACKTDCIQARWKGGVHVARLAEFFDDQTCQVFFRKPKGFTEDLGQRIVYTAASQVGKRYDGSLLFSEAIDGSFVGRILKRIYGESFHEALAKLLNSKEQWICSELAAYALDEQPEFRDKGCLAKPNEIISPQELFEDETIFDDWKQ